jgi:hypothetical protein
MKLIKIFGIVVALVLFGSTTYFLLNPPQQKHLGTDSTSVSADTVMIDSLVHAIDSLGHGVDTIGVDSTK